jgi:hypothetical protein
MRKTVMGNCHPALRICFDRAACCISSAFDDTGTDRTATGVYPSLAHIGELLQTLALLGQAREVEEKYVI